MSVEQRRARPQAKLGLDPAEALMDYLGLPREAKYDMYDAMLDAMPDEVAARLLEAESKAAERKIKRPRVLWDTVQDALLITFKEGTDYSKRVLLDDRRFVDHDAEGNLAGVVLRDVSQGVSLQGLPEDRRISRMLRRRDITVVRPRRTATPS